MVDNFFFKLDLFHAYKQIVLDKDSWKYAIINTHQGLYLYTCLPFGIALAPNNGYHPSISEQGRIHI